MVPERIDRNDDRRPGPQPGLQAPKLDHGPTMQLSLMGGESVRKVVTKSAVDVVEVAGGDAVVEAIDDVAVISSVSDVVEGLPVVVAGKLVGDSTIVVVVVAVVVVVGRVSVELAGAVVEEATVLTEDSVVVNVVAVPRLSVVIPIVKIVDVDDVRGEAVTVVYRAGIVVRVAVVSN